jgi:DNA-binding response OmpR family regulator
MPPKMKQPVRVEKAPILEGVRVLVVEDDFIIALELESILRNAGAEIVGLCRTVTDALALADQGAVTAAILDVRLDGETIAPVARKLARLGTPFFFYTGQVGGDPALSEWPGCTVLAKPASPRAIVAALAALIELSSIQP